MPSGPAVSLALYVLSISKVSSSCWLEAGFHFWGWLLSSPRNSLKLFAKLEIALLTLRFFALQLDKCAGVTLYRESVI